MDYRGRADQREAQYIFDLGFAPCRDAAENQTGWKALPVFDLHLFIFLVSPPEGAPMSLGVMVGQTSRDAPFSRPRKRYLSHHHLVPSWPRRRKSPPPSNILFLGLPNVADLISFSVRGLWGQLDSGKWGYPHSSPQWESTLNGRQKTALANFSSEKREAKRSIGPYWIALEVFLVPEKGIEPSTFSLRTNPSSTD